MSITSTAHAPASTAHAVRTAACPRHGALAGAVALPVIEAYAALTEAAGIHSKPGSLGPAPSPVTASSSALGIVLATFGGTVLCVILGRYATRPARTFTIIAVACTALSLITPLGAFGASLSTRLTLAGGRLIAASIMTTILRHGLSHPQASAAHTAADSRRKP